MGFVLLLFCWQLTFTALSAQKLTWWVAGLAGYVNAWLAG